MSRISIKGVLLGAITELATTNILPILFIIFVEAKYGLGGLRGDQLQRAVNDTIHHSIFLYTVQFSIPAGSSVLGGYIAALIAKRDELLNGALSSCLFVGIGVYTMFADKASSSLLGNVELIAAPILGLFGGYLVLIQKRARRQSGGRP